VHPRALLIRSLLGLLVLVLAGLAAVGGVSLGGTGLVAVTLVAVVTACIAAGIVRDGNPRQSRHVAAEAAWRAGVAAVAVLLLLSGCTVLAGGALTALLAALTVGGLLVWWALRSARTGRRPSASVVPLPGAVGVPVRSLTVEALGREWLRTSAALAQTRGAAARQALVERRREALDELERRDPAGFARWLAEGATVDSDPARYVSSDPTAGYDAA
jgi:hypothetical protein